MIANCARKSCNKEFLKKPKHKVFCSRRCKQYAKDVKYKRVDKKRRPYLKYKKSYCEHCSFIPLHPCQLDVDHIDGNHKNNNEDNLQTLCANCHRLKTHLNSEWDKS